MERIKKTIEVDCPLSHVYNQWTQFEEFPRFMDGVKEVRQLDDQRLHWRADIAGVEKEWTAKITEQLPDDRITWTSESGEYTSGKVDFAKLGTDRTRVALEISYDPQGFIENVGDAVGLVSRRIENDLDTSKNSSKTAAEKAAHGAARSGKGKNRRHEKQEEVKWISKQPNSIPQPVSRALKKSFRTKNCRANKKSTSCSAGKRTPRRWKSRRKKACRPQPKLLQPIRDALHSPQLLAGYRALEPQQSLRAEARSFKMGFEQFWAWGINLLSEVASASPADDRLT
jgi:ribosome-associated toxin RatA of RatAB toxin-antitoxin module